MTNEKPTHEFDRTSIEAIAHPFDRLCVIMKRLLDPGGCPWDREQTHQSLRQYFIEETYEACEAIDTGDDKSLREELGDVALQIVFHAELAERRGAFRVEDAYDAICKKLLDRHPHVFGTVHAPDAETVLKNWEEIKKEEKRRKNGDDETQHVSAVSGVPKALPGLQRAGRIQERAARVGFDWDRTEDVAAKVREEVEEFLAHVGKGPEGKLDEAAMEEEFGDLLFALVNMSRFLNIRAEEAMQKASDKFIRRFVAIEKSAESQGKRLKDMTLAEMDDLWNAVKKAEK
ncbi:nucleoside triphosphate pyrophosphohydrolase [bacterium]|nr:nucleoside triphosphate pyrophosphohydrolase [bacterium]